MVHLRLKKNDSWHTIDLATGIRITGEANYDLLRLEIESAEKTYPFDVPATARNVRFFGTPDNPASLHDMFQEYEAILGHGVNVQKRGVFKLTEVLSGYKGFYKAKASALAKVKDKLIGEVIGTSMARVRGWRSSIDKTRPKDRIVYPTLFMPNFYKKGKFEHREFFPMLNRYEDTEERIGLMNYRFAAENDSRGFAIVPVPRLLDVLDELAAAIGYQVQYNFQTRDIYKILLLCHQAADEPWRGQWQGEMEGRVEYYDRYKDIFYADTLPAITVSEFLKALRVSLGMKFTWKDNDTCEVDLVRDLVKSKRSIDITRYCSPHPQRKEENNDFTFSFAQDGQEDADSLGDYRLKPAVMLRDQLPQATEAQAKECRLVLAENHYYVCKYVDYVWQWVPTAKTFHDEGEGSQVIPTKLLPVPMVDRATVTLRCRVIGDQSEPDTRPKEELPILTFAFDHMLFDRGLVYLQQDDLGWVDEIRIVEPYKTRWQPLGYTELFDRRWYHMRAETEDGFGIPRPYFDEMVTVEIKKKFGFMVPHIEAPGSSNVFDHRNDKFPAYMAFYHGKTPRTDKPGYTELASSSNYDSAGNRMAPFALRYTGEDGLVAYFWEEALQLLTRSEAVKVNARLPVSFLNDYDGRTKLRIRNATYQPMLFRYVIGESGWMEATLELRQLRYNKQLFNDLSEGVLWAADDDSVVADGDGTLILAEGGNA